MSNTFWTADTHFFHRNIIKYCDRPFKDEDEMNKEEVIIRISLKFSGKEWGVVLSDVHSNTLFI